MRTILASCMACFILISPSVASALEFQCEIPNDTRYLRVEIPGEEYLCEVSVTYKESGVREVKWYARNDTLFCSAQAYNLRDRYEDTWNYTCTTWPDRDGIDKLSPSQRLILDQRLKSLIAQGDQATPAYTITGIRATASTPLDNQPGKLALQFFTSNSDFTEIIDDQSESWKISTTIESMASKIDEKQTIESALVHAIAEDGTLEIHTRLEGANSTECYGTQMLIPVGSNGELKARTPHRFVCQDRSAMNEAAATDSQTTNQ